MEYRRVRRAAVAAAVLFLASWLPAPLPRAAPGVNITKRDKVVLDIRPISPSGPVACSPTAPLRLEVAQHGTSVLEFDAGWPDAGSKVRVRLKAQERVPPPGEDHAVAIEAELRFPDGRMPRSTRGHAFSDSSTFLFEVYREGDVPLTLVLEASTVLETTVSGAPVIGAPILLLLEIQRVDAGRSIALETDRLSTFVDQSVAYEFRMGDEPEDESVRVAFRPLRIFGEIAEIDVELSGKLPGPDGVALVSRRERWIASRGAKSTLAFETGDPPTGYRFLVTAQF